MTSTATAEGSYRQPTSLVSEDQLLQLAEIEETKRQWEKEIQMNYSSFTEKLYFVNKLDFIKKLLVPPYSRTCVYAPTGCMKSSMSVALDKFFSAHTSKVEQQQLSQLFVNAVGQEQYDLHAHKYTVFRCSFETLKLEVNSTLEEITKFIYRAFRAVTEELKCDVSVQENQQFIANCKNYNVLFMFLHWLHTKTGKPIVMILDEIDFPLTWLISQTQDRDKVQPIWNMYSKVLDTVTLSFAIVPIAMGFGIHVIRGVLNTKKWDFMKITEESCASYFMFTSAEVQKMVSNYKQKDKLKDKSYEQVLEEIEKCYGGYAFDMYCPASVVRYLENDCSLRLYKNLRRTFDILAIDLPRIRAFLFESFFLDYAKDPDQLTEIQTTSDMRNVNKREVAIANYVFAGLLTAELPKLPNKNKYKDFMDGKYRISIANLENRNIVGFFLESLLNLSSKSTAEQKATALTAALTTFDFKAFEGLVNTFFRNLQQIELCCERDFHNPLHAYLYALLDGETWTSSSEHSKLTGNRVSGKSGRIDIRLKHTSPMLYLYIFELKYSHIYSQKTIDRLMNEAFAQVRSKGYITPVDVDKFSRIVVVAVICVNKIIRVFDRHDIDWFIEKKTDESSIQDTTVSQPELNTTTSASGISNMASQNTRIRNRPAADQHQQSSASNTTTTAISDSNIAQKKGPKKAENRMEPAADVDAVAAKKTKRRKRKAK